MAEWSAGKAADVRPGTGFERRTALKWSRRESRRPSSGART